MEKMFNNGRYIMIRLKRGDRLPEDLLRSFNQLQVSSASILFGVGMLENIQIGYYDLTLGRYRRNRFEKPMELVHLSGTLAEENSLHIHTALADEKGLIHGGHLFTAKIPVVAEIGAVSLPRGSLIRKRDEKVKLDLLNIV